MKMEQVSSNCFAVLNEKNLVCDANGHAFMPETAQSGLGRAMHGPNQVGD